MADETKPKRKAKDNPWYRLATFHGEPASANDEKAVQNRATWNRWMAARLSDDLRADLLNKGHTLEELTPFPEDELQAIESRVGTSAEASIIDFSNTEFDAPFFAQAFIFTDDISFADATFSWARFEGATFEKVVIFVGATCSEGAHFERVTFFNWASFACADFAGGISFSGATFTKRAEFGRVTISEGASFEDTTFAETANFRTRPSRGLTLKDRPSTG